MNIALVGGGRASVILLDFLVGLDDVRVVGIADQNPSAPGIVRAKALGIDSARNLEQLVARGDVHLVIEVTGKPEVLATVLKALGPGQDVMSAQGARLMCALIERQQHANATRAEKLSAEFELLGNRLSGAVAGVDTSLGMANEILRAMRMIVVNASVEAARLGAQGSAFAIIAAELRQMVRTVEAAVAAIAKASGDMAGALVDLQDTERRLRDTFH